MAKSMATALGFGLGVAVVMVVFVGLETIIVYYLLTGLIGLAVTPIQILGGVLLAEFLKSRFPLNSPQSK